MRSVPILEHDVVGRWARVPADQPAVPILISLADAETRIGVSAGLVAAGCRIFLSRSAPQAAALVPAVDAVVGDARFLATVRPRARDVLRAAPLLILANARETLPEAPAWLATAVLRAPFDVDDVVTIVLRVARGSRS